MQIDTSFYPISIDEIKYKVSKKNNNRNGKYKNSKYQYVLFNEDLPDNAKEIINEFDEKIIQVDGEIPPELKVNDNDRFLFISYDQSFLTHGLHRYPAKFFPELPRWFIKKYSKENDIVIDPFSGSGTTNVEALLNNRHSVGIDVDPFSRFLSNVKTHPLNENDLLLAKKNILDLVIKYHPNKVSQNDIPDFPYRDNWFNNEIVYELAYIKNIITNLRFNEYIKNYFRICFSSILRSVSNADDNCTRTVIRKKLNKIVKPADALKRFTETMLVNIPKMIEFSKKCPTTINAKFPENMDARNIKYPDHSFDLAVTSPPYANAVDYPRTHQLEIYWLGFANGSLTPLKKRHVGTESVTVNDYNALHKIDIPEADYVISKIFEKDKRRAFIVYKYLDDMRKNLAEIYRVLKKGGRYIIVVGNNTIRGEIFENWKYILQIAQDLGFIVENYFGSEIIRHFIKVPREERINTDWILVLRK